MKRTLLPLIAVAAVVLATVDTTVRAEPVPVASESTTEAANQEPSTAKHSSAALTNPEHQRRAESDVVNPTRLGFAFSGEDNGQLEERTTLAPFAGHLDTSSAFTREALGSTSTGLHSSSDNSLLKTGEGSSERVRATDTDALVLNKPAPASPAAQKPITRWTAWYRESKASPKPEERLIFKRQKALHRKGGNLSDQQPVELERLDAEVSKAKQNSALRRALKAERQAQLDAETRLKEQLLRHPAQPVDAASGRRGRRREPAPSMEKLLEMTAPEFTLYGNRLRDRKRSGKAISPFDQEEENLALARAKRKVLKLQAIQQRVHDGGQPALLSQNSGFELLRTAQEGRGKQVVTVQPPESSSRVTADEEQTLPAAARYKRPRSEISTLLTLGPSSQARVDTTRAQKKIKTVNDDPQSLKLSLPKHDPLDLQLALPGHHN